MTDLVSKSRDILTAAGKDVTDEGICDHLICSHFPKCSQWQDIASIPLVKKYLLYLMQCLKIRKFVCADIILLHNYLQESRGVLPDSQGQLLHFYSTGKIPTSNLHLLTAVPLTANSITSCGICHESIPYGTHVYQLQCGHVFHSMHNHCRCNVKRWLESTNRCPCCNEVVILESLLPNDGGVCFEELKSKKNLF